MSVLFTLKTGRTSGGTGGPGVPSASGPRIRVVSAGVMGLVSSTGPAVVSGAAGLTPAVPVFDTWAMTADVEKSAIERRNGIGVFTSG